jgi:hypothetical protein
MPQQVDFVNGKLVITGDDTANDHTPMPDAPATPAPKAKPKPKPKGKPAPAKPWWQNLTHAVTNELKYAGKVIQGLEATQTGPVKPGIMGLVDAVNPIGGALRQAGRYSPTVRQIKAAATYGAAQTAGEGIIAIGQRVFKGAKFADPKASRLGRALNAFTRAGYAADGAKQPEDLTEPQRGIIDTTARSLGVEAGTAALVPPVKLFQGASMVSKGLRLGTRLGLAHGLSSFTQDSTLGNMSNMAEALTGQKIPGAVDPLKDDRVTAGMKSVLPNLVGGEALGLGIAGGARALGKAGDMFPNIARQKRALRANTEHTTANEAVKATGLVEDVDGRQQFTQAGRAKPAPLKLTVDERTQQILDRFKPSKPADDGGVAPAPGPAAPVPPPPPGLPDDAAPAPTGKPSLQVAEEPPAVQIDPAEEFWDNGDLPEVADVQKTLGLLDDDELTALAAAGADGGPVLQQLNDVVATRPAPRIRAEVSEDAAGMPTANLSELYLNGAGDLEPWIKQFDKIPTVTLQELAHPEASPRLFELIHAATGRDWEAFTRPDIVAGIKEFSAQGTTILPNRLRDDVTLTPIGKVVARPKEFQYKENVNAKGEQMGHSLGGVDKWNPNLEGVVDTFTDPKTGETVVVNGHNRRALAERLGVPSLITREVDATTPPAARAEGAMSNIAAGAGTPFDAAKFIKATGLADAAQLDAAGIPIDKGYGRQGLALSKLPAEIFQDAINEAHDLGRYLDLGASGLDEAGMRGAYQVLQQRPKMSAGAFREVIGKAGEQGNVITASPQGSLFGDDVLNPIAQWAELVADVRQGLSREKRIFGNSIKNAGALGEAGVADVNTGIAGQRVTDATYALDLFDRLKNAPGPLADVLNRGAAEIASGSKPGVIAKQVQREIADNIETYLSEAGLRPRGGADTPAPVAPTAAPPPLAAITPEVLPPVARADLERHALQRAIANGEVRPTETGPVEVPEGLGGDWGDAQHDLVLGAEYQASDAQMRWEAEKAMREAEGYDFKPWEERQRDSGVGDTWFTSDADTRGQGRNFHGAADQITLERWGEFGGDGMNIYGDGFYTTDDVATAAKYRKKNRRDAGSGAQPTVYEVNEKQPVKFFDLEVDDSPAVNDLLNDIVAQGRYGSGLVEQAIEDASSGTLGEIMDEMRAWSGSMEIPAHEVQEIFQEIINTLQSEGYGGFTHTGGTKAGGGKRLHKVSIYWNPADAIGLKEMKPLAAAPGAIAPEVVQPAAKGPISGVMRDVIQKMKESDVKSFSILASQLFETDWILERGKKYKGMTKEEAQAAFIQDFGQRMQDAQSTQPLPVAASGDGKPKKLSETLRGVIDAMKASDERLDDLGEQVFDLRRRAMELELGDVGELPPPARKALVAAEVSNAPPFVLPADLSKAAPRYGNKKLEFESDLDRTAYMLASDRTKGESKAAQKYRETLAAAGFNADQVAAHGAMVKKAVKDGVKDADGATAVIPVQPFGGDTPRLPLPEQGRQAGKASQKVADIKDQINKGGCGL